MIWQSFILYFSSRATTAADPGGRDLRRGSAAARLLGMRVRIPPGAWLSLVNVVCYHVEVCATDRSLIQRSPTECVCMCVIERDQVKQ